MLFVGISGSFLPFVLLIQLLFMLFSGMTGNRLASQSPEKATDETTISCDSEYDTFHLHAKKASPSFHAHHYWLALAVAAPRTLIAPEIVCLPIGDTSQHIPKHVAYVNAGLSPPFNA